MKSNFFYLISFVTLWQYSAAQVSPDIVWSKLYGGAGYEQATCIQPTSDGGYIVGGTIPPNDTVENGVTTYGGNDIWILKLDNSGNIEWNKHYGGNMDEFLGSIKETPDKGFIFCGATYSNNSFDVGVNHSIGYADGWVVKLDSSGTIQWQKCYGGSDEDQNTDIQICKNGYILCGVSESSDGDLTGNVTHGNYDAWIMKIDSLGNLIWSKSYGGSNDDEGISIIATPGNESIVAAVTTSSDFDVANCNYHGGADYWILKLDSLGNIRWKKCFGGSNGESPSSIFNDNNGSFIIAGNTDSNDGDVSGNHGGSDYWIIKIDSTGTLLWQKCLGGTGVYNAGGASLTSDGNFVVAGYTFSDDGDVTFNHDTSGTFTDAWIVKLNQSGGIIWQHSFGGYLSDGAFTVCQGSDEAIVFAGGSYSSDGDLATDTNHELSDYWIAKLSLSTEVRNVFTNDLFLIYPNPASTKLTISSANIEPNCAYTITDITGRIIIRGTLDNTINHIAIDKLANGMYFLQVGDKGRQTFKVIKE